MRVRERNPAERSERRDEQAVLLRALDEARDLHL